MDRHESRQGSENRKRKVKDVMGVSLRGTGLRCG